MQLLGVRIFMRLPRRESLRRIGKMYASYFFVILSAYGLFCFTALTFFIVGGRSEADIRLQKSHGLSYTGLGKAEASFQEPGNDWFDQ